MSESLKPCPHCGKDARLIDSRLKYGFTGDAAYGTFYVRCVAGCGSLTKKESDAIGIWNLRAPVALKEAEAVEKVIEAAKQKYRSLIYTSGVSQEFADQKLVDAVEEYIAANAAVRKETSNE